MRAFVAASVSVGCLAWLWSCSGEPFSVSPDDAGTAHGGVQGSAGFSGKSGASGASAQGNDSSTGGRSGASTGGAGGAGATGGTALVDASKGGTGGLRTDSGPGGNGGSGGTGAGGAGGKAGGGTGGSARDGGSECGPQISCIDCCTQKYPDGANQYAIYFSGCACVSSACIDPCLIFCAAGEVFVADCVKCIDLNSGCNNGRSNCSSSATCAPYSACIHACS